MSQNQNAGPGKKPKYVKPRAKITLELDKRVGMAKASQRQTADMGEMEFRGHLLDLGLDAFTGGSKSAAERTAIALERIASVLEHASGLGSLPKPLLSFLTPPAATTTEAPSIKPKRRGKRYRRKGQRHGSSATPALPIETTEESS